jgi:membrane-associated protease RseP (regulator of RpoE activity)
MQSPLYDKSNAMNRSLRVVGILAFTGVVVFALWSARTPSAGHSGRETLKDTIKSAITSPIQFANAHFTGGIGVILISNALTGGLRVQGLVDGSPAKKAGLREGDVIIQIDGIATRGQTMEQNIKCIKGFAAGSVTLIVQREGSTNLQFVIHRSSWNSIGVGKIGLPVAVTNAPLWPRFQSAGTGGVP